MGEVLGRAVSGTEVVSREQWPERLKNGLDALKTGAKTASNHS